MLISSMAAVVVHDHTELYGNCILLSNFKQYYARICRAALEPLQATTNNSKLVWRLCIVHQGSQGIEASCMLWGAVCL